MNYDNEVLFLGDDNKDLKSNKHCNECGAHWVPDDDEDPQSFTNCVECGSNDIETCNDPFCVKSSMAEENYAYARQDYPRSIRIAKRMNKEGKEEEYPESYYKVFTGEELRLGDYDKNGYRLIGVGLKGMDAVVALWITPQPRPQLKMDAGVNFRAGSPYFEGYAGNDVSRADPFPEFREKFKTLDNPKGTRTSLANYSQVVELFNVVCDKYGLKEEPRIWEGAERAVEDAKVVGGGGGGSSNKTVTDPLKLLEIQYANGEIDDVAFVTKVKDIIAARKKLEKLLKEK